MLLRIIITLATTDVVFDATNDSANRSRPRHDAPPAAVSPPALARYRRGRALNAACTPGGEARGLLAFRRAGRDGAQANLHTY